MTKSKASWNLSSISGAIMVAALSIRIGHSWQLPTKFRLVGRTVNFRRRTLSTSPWSLGMAPAPLEEGDQVQVNVEGDFFTGIIKERRGSGWYSVGVPSNDGEDIIKVRGGQLSPLFLSDAEQTNTTSVRILNDVFNFRNLGAKQSESLAPPPPTIIDLDAAIATHAFDDLEDKRDRLFMQQCAHHASFDRWVMFTDLHCAPSSLVTCLEVLRTVHGAALDRNAGVIFLGDFWHQRAVIRVNVLNAILDELRSWEVPLVMIPGNHDQVTLGGHTHGLTPLENAYQIDLKGEKARSAVPGPLIFSYPTKFRDALFVPHIRDNTVMETVLQSSVATESVALLVHADITGAYMNDLLVSSGGVSPAVFPSDKPIYSGHFHKPHAVKSGSVRIDYVGSTYETSLAEAQQPKALWVVDAGQNWDCVEKIPIHVGRKHFRAVSINEFAKLGVFQECNGVDQTDPDPGPTSSNEDLMAPPIVRAGDRVVVSVAERELEEARRAAHDGETNEFDAKVKALRSAGALVEVREVKSAVLDAKGMIVAEDVSMLEEMTPQKALAAFCSQEARRENMSNSSAEELLKAGLLLIDDLELSEGHSNAFSVSANTTSLVVQSVAIKGFGPFKDEVKYPLLDRGLVLLRGTNRDGGSDSNGSGKSFLAMSTLWALTGTVDPRPVQDSRVSDVVNDFSKVARVTIRGELNDSPFILSRAKTASKGSLSFHLGGEDLTMQSMRETQLVVDEKLGTCPEILARSMFHGQHAVNGLLEATDAKIKEELSLIVPLSLWQNGASLARKKSRDAGKRASEVKGMISLRSKDLEDLARRRDAALEIANKRASAYREQEEQLRQLIEALGELADKSLSSTDCTLDSVEAALSEATNLVRAAEEQHVILASERDIALAGAEKSLQNSLQRHALAEERLHEARRVLDRALINVEATQEHQKQLEKKWSIDLSSERSHVIPNICPTCKQPFSNIGKGHSHDQLRQTLEDEIASVLRSLTTAQESHQNAVTMHKAAVADFKASDALKRSLLSTLRNLEEEWKERLQSVEAKIQKSRDEQLRLSAELSSESRRIRTQSEIETKRSAVRASHEALNLTQTTYDDMCRDFAEAENNLDDMKLEIVNLQRVSKTMSDLADVFGQRGIQTFLLQNAVEALQSTCQAYLDELSDGNQVLELSLDSGDRIVRRAFVRGSNGSLVERPLSSLSGGQWRRCSIALSLGFADLVARRGKLRPSFIVLDEPLTHLDRTGRARVGALLRKLLRNAKDESGSCDLSASVGTILLVLQDLAAEELEESFDRIDEVVKVDGLSSVVVDEQALG